MSIVTLQVGQAGCQAGAALFQQLADEAALDRPGWSPAADRFFYLASVGGQARPTARAVLVDSEPTAVIAAHAAASTSGTWQYSKAAAAARQLGGSGDSWARGALAHGPALRAEVLGMLRRQVERCDSLSGFLVLQSLAGGSGSGLCSALMAALRDEYPSARLLSHCFWPFESGEVAVQPYNTLLGLSSLAEHSSGVIQTENEALTATCQRLLGIQRPSFADLNAVASRSLAALLLPCTRRQAPSIAAAAGNGSAGGRTRGGARGRPVWDSGSPTTPSAAAAGQQTAAAWDGTFGSGSRWLDEEPAGGSSRAGVGGAFDPFSDACDRLCSSASHHLLTLRGGPQLPPSSFDFTPFAWPSVLKDLKQWQLAGAAVEPGVGRGGGSALLDSNQALASLLVLRGDQAAAADVDCMADTALYSAARRHAVPLAVAASGSRLGGQQMLATLLSNDQTPMAPVGRMLARARLLYDARAYMHQFERHGLSSAEVGEALESVAGLLDAYHSL